MPKLKLAYDDWDVVHSFTGLDSIEKKIEKLWTGDDTPSEVSLDLTDEELLEVKEILAEAEIEPIEE